MKYISKQWRINVRDFINSLYLGIIVPSLVSIQMLLDNTSNWTWQDVCKVFIGTVIANIIRKMAEPSKVVQITPLSKEDDGTNPPPMGDPTHPKK